MKNLRKIAIAITATIAMLCGVVVYLTLDQVTDRLTAAEDRAQVDRRERTMADAKVEALGQQLEALGETPIVEPDTKIDPRVQVVPIPGRPGLIGPRGRVGAAGRTPDPVPGPAGDAGRPGASIKGDPGAKGEKGDPPSTDTLLELIRRVYFENPPKDGSDGRGITDTQCGDDGRWTITYTDGATRDGGPCRVDLLPDPDPDPEPTE